MDVVVVVVVVSDVEKVGLLWQGNELRVFSGTRCPMVLSCQPYQRRKHCALDVDSYR